MLYKLFYTLHHHVIYDKPLANSAEEIRPIVTLAQHPKALKRI
jgi:predicted dehydrogenase